MTATSSASIIALRVGALPRDAVRLSSPPNQRADPVELRLRQAEGSGFLRV